MEFADSVRALSSRVREQKGNLATEEATKNALILPFLQMLGYDVFDPRIVMPEFTSDVGTKKKEKVDFAVLKDGEPIILIEAKCCGDCLDQGKATQLHRYFQNTPSARIAILTDGVKYEFYSDLDKPNIMDTKPFMVFDFERPEDKLIPKLAKLTRDNFDIEDTLSTAQGLKYTREIQALVAAQFANPDEQFVKFFASKVYSGQLRSNVLEEFKGRVKHALQDYVNGLINDRLKSAMALHSEEPIQHSVQESKEVALEDEAEESTPGVVTTDEEMEAYYIVKSILRNIVSADRIFMRDTKSYCGVLLDNNNRKPICRFRFDGRKKQLSLIDGNKQEAKVIIESLDDIFLHSDALAAAVKYYDQPASEPEE